MQKNQAMAIAALSNAIAQVDILTTLSENIENKAEKAEALRLARRSTKQAKRLHLFLSKYAPDGKL